MQNLAILLGPPARYSVGSMFPNAEKFALRFGALAAVVVPLLAGCATPTLSPTVDAAAAWAKVPTILQRIVPPTFPQCDYSIVQFGAVGDGTHNCTAAFSNAVATCARAGGGRVVVPAGKFRTGPVHLRSNVELHLAAGSELIFSDRFADYLPPVLVRVGGIELYNYSPLIYARDCTNIAVTGPGKLNGNARAWWALQRQETNVFFQLGARGVPVAQRVFGTPEAAIRPSFISFVGCTNVLLEGFTIGSGPNWTIHPVYCINTTIRRVNVDTDGPNNDGIDPDSCRDVLIEDCTFATGDDCVVLKSGYNEDGWRVGRPTENVIMRRCSSRHGHGGLVIGSEMSGSVSNVFMEDCTFDGTDRAIRIKSKRGRGGVVENVFARNLHVRNMQREVVILNMDYGSDKQPAANEKPPVFRRMAIENITAEGAPTAILISGLADSPITDIVFDGLTIASKKGVVASHVKGLTFDRVAVHPATGPVFDMTDAANLTIRRAVAPAGTSVFLKLSGARSANVRISDSDLAAAKERVAVSDGAVPGAVTFTQP